MYGRGSRHVCMAMAAAGMYVWLWQQQACTVVAAGGMNAWLWQHLACMAVAVAGVYVWLGQQQGCMAVAAAGMHGCGPQGCPSYLLDTVIQQTGTSSPTMTECLPQHQTSDRASSQSANRLRGSQISCAAMSSTSLCSICKDGRVAHGSGPVRCDTSVVPPTSSLAS